MCVPFTSIAFNILYLPQQFFVNSFFFLFRRQRRWCEWVMTHSCPNWNMNDLKIMLAGFSGRRFCFVAENNEYPHTCSCEILQFNSNDLENLWWIFEMIFRRWHIRCHYESICINEILREINSDGSQNIMLTTFNCCISL